MLQYWGKLSLWQKVIVGMVLGIVLGHFMPQWGQHIKPFGQIFANCLKMIVVPLVFFSILYGVTSISDVTNFSRIGGKALLTYSCTTVFAVCIGLTFATILQPGVGVNIDLHHSSGNIAEAKKVSDILMDVVPTNPIASMASGNTVQLALFSFFVGFALILIGDKGNPVKELIVSTTMLIFKMVELVLKLTPYGVFCIMYWVISEYGLGLLVALGKFVITVLLAFLFQYILFGIMLLFMGKVNPLPFYRKMVDTQVLAFTTASSKATLPTAMREMQQKLGVSQESATFILPLGASMNMDGIAIYLGICSVFFAQVIGMELSLTQYAIIVLTSTIGSIGGAGIPGGAMVMMGMVLSAVGLPLEGMSIILGVERIIDMFRTTINLTGDCTVTVIVDSWEGKLDRIKYNTDSIL